jgi:hypothetical protein
MLWKRRYINVIHKKKIIIPTTSVAPFSPTEYVKYVLFIIQTLFLEIVIYFSCSMGNLKNWNLKKYLRRLVFYFIDTKINIFVKTR